MSLLRIDRQMAPRLYIVCCSALLVSLNSFAFLGLGGTSWKEEVLLHDGSKIVVERWVKRGGRHEIGQQPGYQEQRLQFINPSTNKKVVWEDRKDEYIGGSTFLPMLVDIADGTPYLVAKTMGCLAYSKWGRPNPPYVVFRYDGDQWNRIPLAQLPSLIVTPNVIHSSPDTVVEKLGKSFVTAEEIKRDVSEFRQPEYRSIVREPLPSSRLCPPELTGFKAPYPMPPKSGLVGGK